MRIINIHRVSIEHWGKNSGTGMIQVRNQIINVLQVRQGHESSWVGRHLNMGLSESELKEIDEKLDLALAAYDKAIKEDL